MKKNKCELCYNLTLRTDICMTCKWLFIEMAGHDLLDDRYKPMINNSREKA